MNGDAKVYFYDSKIKEFVANLFNWQSVTVLEDYPLSVVVTFKVYRILDTTMTFEQFYDKTQHRVGPCLFPAQLTGVILPCSKCRGNGQLDWVEKVMTTTFLNSPPDPYERDVRAKVLKFKILSKNYTLPDGRFFPDLKMESDYVENYTVYVSRPYLKKCKDYCPECHGSGTRIIKNCEKAKEK